MPFDVVTIGDIKLDTFVVLDDANLSCQLKMPECQLCMEFGAKIPVNVVDSQIAGTAPNVAVGLARMNLKTAVMSVMGEDSTYHLALARLREENVSTKYIRTIKGIPSAYSVILTFKGDRTVLASQTKRMYVFPKPFPKTKWIFVGELGSTYEKMYREIATFIRRDHTQLAFNPGAIQIRDRKKELFMLIKQTSILFVNLQEAQAILDEKTDEIHHLATSLWKLGAKRVIITDGKQGSYDFDGETLLKCPVFPGKLVGTIGAGDAFATGYLSALLKRSKTHPLVWGSVNSSSVIGAVGPQEGLLGETQLTKRLRAHKSFGPKKI